MKKNLCAEIIKKVMDLVLTGELYTVSSPLSYQEETPELFYERFVKNDCEENK